MRDRFSQRLLAIAGVLVIGVLLLVPTIVKEGFGSTVNWPLSSPLSLGLDLRGGVHLVYQVMTKEAVRGHLQTTGNTIKGALRDSKVAVIRAKPVDEQTLEIVVVSDAMAERARAKIGEDYRELEFVEKTAEGDRTRLLYKIPPKTAKEIEEKSVSQAVETLRNRVDQFGVAEPLITRQGVDRILLQMPGYSDIERVKQVVGKTARLEFRLVPVSASSEAVTLKDRQGVNQRVEEQVLMGGEAIADARPDISGGRVEVGLKLTSDGGRLFRQITTEHTGRQLAIVLDGVVYSAPVIREPISHGAASISGSFSVEEAQQLSVVLRAGALPAPLQVAEERTVGPSLGKESIQKGIVAILAGFLAIAVFMAVYYRKAGWIAIFALSMNLFLLVAGLSFFGATLTLPGLAGLALTVGMAVDSNVIIFERIRDELKAGIGRDSAVRGGFDKASSAILDTNVTVLVSGFLLYLFGTGPVKGFAVSLTLGVFTTLFCAVVITRFLFDSFDLRDKAGKLSI